MFYQESLTLLELEIVVRTLFKINYVSVTFGYQVFRHRDGLSRVVRSVVKAFVDTPLFNLTTPFEIQLLL